MAGTAACQPGHPGGHLPRPERQAVRVRRARQPGHQRHLRPDADPGGLPGGRGLRALQGACPGNENYVLFDPAAGLNRFHPILTDAVEPGEPTWQFQVDLVVHAGLPADRRRRHLRAGVHRHRCNDAARRPSRVNGGPWAVALRRYAEGAGFEPLRVTEACPATTSPTRAARAQHRGTLLPLRPLEHPPGRPAHPVAHLRSLAGPSEGAARSTTGSARSRRASKAGTRPSAFRALEARVAEPTIRSPRTTRTSSSSTATPA